MLAYYDVNWSTEHGCIASSFCRENPPTPSCFWLNVDWFRSTARLVHRSVAARFKNRRRN